MVVLETVDMKMCEGRFSPETEVLLQEAYKREGMSARETFATYRCVNCGKSGLIAKNYGGQWIPKSHYPPPRKRVNPSAKSGYYKR
jgi:hypothetical protein